METFIPPFSDMFIMYLWGTEKHKNLLLSFINTVLQDSDLNTLESVEIQNPFNVQKFITDKKSILDIRAKDPKGRIYNIEVQRAEDPSFIQRSLYYWSRIYSSQLKKKEIYSDLKPTICMNYA